MAGLESAEWDVLVVGGGIIGCAIAYEASRRGARTAILEAHSPGAGATQASAGVLAPYIEAPADGPLHDLTVRSLALYDKFIADVSADADVAVEYRRCGTLEVAEDDRSAAALRGLGDWARSKGVEAEWLTAAQVARTEPSVRETVGGLLVPSHGYVRASQLTAALVSAARRYGAAVHVGERVESIDCREGPAVRAGRATYRARKIVLAAGSWSSELAPETTVMPVRGQLLQLHSPATRLTHVLWSERCYIVPWTDGTILVGATVEDAGFDARVTADGVRSLLDAACALLPSLGSATFVEARVGLRPSSASGLPIIAPSSAHPGLIYATGHFRNGILLAPLTAQMVVALL